MKPALELFGVGLVGKEQLHSLGTGVEKEPATDHSSRGLDVSECRLG